MNLTNTQRFNRFSERLIQGLQKRSINLFVIIIAAALLAFEIFSFSTMEFALQEMLGELSVGFWQWSTILSLALCGMDFAGIARLLTYPHGKEKEEPGGWFLLGAWVLAAAMNTGLTWWGVSVAIYNQPADSVLILDPLTFATVIPVFVSIGVWIVRILIIGTLIHSFRVPVNAKSSKTKEVHPQPFGFNSSPNTVPSGFRPLSTRAYHSNNQLKQE